MSRPTRNRILLVAVFLGLAVVSAPQAQACWSWGCWGGYRSPCWSSGWCCSPCYVNCACCYTPCYTPCWSYGYYDTPGCYASCYEVECCYEVEVEKPADAAPKRSQPPPEPEPAPPEPAPAAPKPEKELSPPRPEPAEPETNISPPRPEPAEAAPTLDASPLEPRSSVLRPVPKRPSPSVDQPPMSIPDVRGMPAEPQGPAAPAAPTPAPAEKTTPAEPQARIVPAGEQASGVIGVWVPAKARVVINGLETTSTGPYREYISHGLKPGAVYKYEIRAQVARHGRLVEKVRTVYLTAGAHQRVAFRFEVKPEQAIAAR